MAEQFGRLSDSELEGALVDLGEHLGYPAAPALWSAVRAHIEARPVRPRHRFLRSPAVFYPLLAALIILASVLVLSPGARTGLASWFHFRGVQIEFGGVGRQPLGHKLNLGKRVSLVEAQRQVPFRILVPTMLGLRKPDETYVGAGPMTGSVSLVYRTRAGLPRASTTGAGLLITEFRRAFYLGKVLPFEESIVPVDFDGMRGIWLAGKPHDLYYVNTRGRPLRNSGRLAGNALIWERSYVTLRMEGRISEGRAIAIAESMRRWKSK